jgi:hypothetical protein
MIKDAAAMQSRKFAALIPIEKSEKLRETEDHKIFHLHMPKEII